MEPWESSKQQGSISSPPVAQFKKHPIQKSSEKKRPKEKVVEVSQKGVDDTLVRFSTPLRSKNPRITVKIPSSPPNPIKRANTRSQLRAFKALPTSTLEVVPISIESQEKDKDGP